MSSRLCARRGLRLLLRVARDNLSCDPFGFLKRLIGKALQQALIGPGRPDLAQFLVEQAEFEALTVHLEDENGLSGRGGFGGHIGGIFGDQHKIGSAQEGEIGIVALTVPDDAGKVAQAR